MFFRPVLAAVSLLTAMTWATADDGGKAPGGQPPAPAAAPSAVSAAPAASAASTPAAKTAAAGAAADQDRVVCRTERPMGSLIPKRICKTVAQWDAERESSRKMMQDLQQRTGATSSR